MVSPTGRLGVRIRAAACRRRQGLLWQSGCWLVWSLLGVLRPCACTPPAAVCDQWRRAGSARSACFSRWPLSGIRVVRCTCAGSCLPPPPLPCWDCPCLVRCDLLGARAVARAWCLWLNEAPSNQPSGGPRQCAGRVCDMATTISCR